MTSYFGKLRNDFNQLKKQIKMRGLADFLIHSDFSLASIDDIIEALENPNKTVRVEISVIEKGDNMVFNATDAKKLTEATAASVSGMQAVFDAIKKTAKEGRNHMTYSTSLLRKGMQPSIVVEELKKAGYQAKYNFDQRDGDYLEIKW